MTRDFKVGDEVEFTRRGIVSQVGEWFDGRAFVRVADREIKLYADDRVTKVEPAWSADDVIIYHGRWHPNYATLIFDGSRWRDRQGESREILNVSEAWKDGRITRLVPEAGATF